MSQLLAQCDMTLNQYNSYIQALTSSSVILMKRDVKDCWVNNYNPHLLTAWNANMDIQYILDEYGCIMYMLSYISKPERELSDYLKTIVKEMSPETATEREEMKEVLQAYSKHREVSAQESVARTCSLKMKSCSREVVFLPTGDNALKMSLPLSALQNKPADSLNLFAFGNILLCFDLQILSFQSSATSCCLL